MASGEVKAAPHAIALRAGGGGGRRVKPDNDVACAALYTPTLWSIWSIVREGSAQPASPITLAGTPATVTLLGTGLMTTEPAAMRAQWPISMLPRIFAPAPIMTPLRILG